MKGHLRERPEGSGNWYIMLDVGERDPRTGKKKRKWHSFKGTKREAQKEAARLITALNEGKYIEPSKATVAAYFERWLAHVKPQVSPKTHERYTEILTKNLEPLIGTLTLAKLRTAHIDQAFSTALVSGRRDGKGGLSPRNCPPHPQDRPQGLLSSRDVGSDAEESRGGYNGAEGRAQAHDGL